ncbi:putative oxidoreductase [Lachnellula occidentalis]|uniref:Putative oxidoreductase n=1 Tax=Lachnellula occidentalis TaxID=215460 RepID=A0A8H8S7I6_9HELO|nr:putative oxidoreductase [Lachnellula occidentalis]
MQFKIVLVPFLATTILPVWCQKQQPILRPQVTTIEQPLIGFGTYLLTQTRSSESDNTTAAVSFAIQTGYRQIDCAAYYKNERAVGRGIAEGLLKANLSRSDIWVTSKLWNDRHGDYDVVEATFNKTLSDLGLEYLDLYLLHWPVDSSSGKSKIDYIKTWNAMSNLPKSKVRNIGISNFSPEQLCHLISETGVKPAVHQMELHPYLQQSSWVAAHRALGISVTAYSPLGNSSPDYRHSPTPSRFSSLKSILRSCFSSNEKDITPPPPPLLQNTLLKEIAERRNCSVAQVALSWNVGRGVSVIPKSSHERWIKENYESLECELGVFDFAQLEEVGAKYLTRFSNPSEEWGVELFRGLDDA